MKSRRYGLNRALRVALLVGGLVGIACALDYLYGEVSGIAEVREDARRFRAEAAELRLSTRALVPDLRHSYPNPYRPEGDAFLPTTVPRQFNTTTKGTVSTGSPAAGPAPSVLFLGGSTTECNEVDEQFRFSSVVEQNLRRLGVPVRTINAGVRGHTTLDAINTLLNRPGIADADVIVLMENINDRLLLALRDGYGSELSDAGPTTLAAVRVAAMATVRSAWEYLAYRSNLLFFSQHVANWFGGGHSTERGYVTERTLDDLPPPSPVAQALYARKLRIFVAVVRAMSKAPVLMTQPLGKQSAGQASFNDIVRAVARETNTTLVDLDRQLPEDRGWAYLGDHIHFSNRGSREVGGIITAALAPKFGLAYSAPAPDTGLTPLQKLVELCPSDESVSDTARVPRLFRIVGDSGRYPSVSADGRWLLFQARPDRLDRIRALRLSDHRLFEVTPIDARVHERHPAFLNTDEQGFSVVFGHGVVGEAQGHERLMVRSWPSGETKPLYEDDTLAGSIPSVSGRSVFFAGTRDQEGSRIPNLYRFDRSQNTVERLTESRAEEWRPVGTDTGDVYFISDIDGRFAIYRRDTHTKSNQKVISSPAGEWDPALSPDGKWLAFASKRHGSWDVFIAPTADPSRVTRLTDLPGDEWDPAWHPNGRVLLLGSAQSREPQIVAMCAFGDPQGLP